MTSDELTTLVHEISNYRDEHVNPKDSAGIFRCNQILIDINAELVRVKMITEDLTIQKSLGDA